MRKIGMAIVVVSCMALQSAVAQAPQAPDLSSSFTSVRMLAAGFWPFGKSRVEKVLQTIEETREAAVRFTIASKALDESSPCGDEETADKRTPQCARAVSEALQALEDLTEKTEALVKATFALNVREASSLKATLEDIGEVIRNEASDISVPEGDYDVSDEEVFTEGEKIKATALFQRYLAAVVKFPEYPDEY